MKILAIAAAVTVTLAGASAASAQHEMHARTTTVQRSSSWHDDGGRHNRWHWKTQCTTKWRGHHKIRTCRKVRVRW